MAIAAIVIATFATWFHFGWGGTTVVRWVDDIACSVGSGVAALCCALAARRDRGSRTSWWLLSAGTAAWSLGNVVWCWYDLRLGTMPPMASLADVGFLALPVLASIALIMLPAGADDSTRLRWGLDGALVSLAGLMLVWSTVIEPTSAVHASTATTAVAIAFPILDVALLTTAVLAVLHTTMGRRRLLGVAAALGWLAGADAVFGYLSISGKYQTGAGCDVAYIAAFTVLAAATFLPAGDAPRRRWTATAEPIKLALPYLPFAVAGAVALGRHFSGHPLDGMDLTLWGAATACVLGRQAIVLAQNRRLLQTVQAQRDELQQFAMADPLTGLANRALFTDRVAHAVTLHARDLRPVALAWIDVDDFKIVNDTYGHPAGDELLVKLSERLRATVRAGDTVARLGGDEFAVLVEDGSDPFMLAERICSVVSRPYLIGGRAHTVTASVGIATLLAEEGAVAPAELISRADIAMYQAKSSGKNQVAIFQPGMTLPGAADLSLRSPLHTAIRDQEIAVHYQPLVSARSGRLYGYEALARWDHGGSAVSPERFVALADRFGFGRELGDYILDLSIEQAAQWIQAQPDLVMAVNLAPSQLLDPDLPTRVLATLHRHRLPAGNLVLEITEAALLTESETAVDVARRLTAAGIRLALDDFGTGYSSLAHLRGFPLAGLKIDRSFVNAVDSDPKAREFITAVIRLGHDLGLTVVVEGIETDAQLRCVKQLGATLLQGYFFDRPQPADAVDLQRNWAEQFAALMPPQREGWHEALGGIRPSVIPTR